MSVREVKGRPGVFDIEISCGYEKVVKDGKQIIKQIRHTQRVECQDRFQALLIEEGLKSQLGRTGSAIMNVRIGFRPC